MKYSAINIGPIIATLGMARKPRELWAASFLFSHLMKCIYGEAEKTGATIISPAKPKEEKNKVGIYPDRIYLKGEVDVKRVISEAVISFYYDLLGDKTLDLSYFNLMSTTCEADKESEAIATLNQQLDILELCNYATDGDAAQTIYDIISEKKDSPLFNLADGKYIKEIKSIEDIAGVQRKGQQEIKEKSHHRYICVVQADGDNVGKTVSHPSLNDGEVLEISKELVQFGLDATKLIDEFGGLPIYGNLIKASLSFGVSITYYKYPLYEALESARNLLFGKAKGIRDKKAVAWSLRKHSGGTFEAAFSLKETELKTQFENLIAATTDKDTVSAIAHKLRQEEALVNIVLESNSADRLDALFEKVLEFDKDKASYFNAVKAIMPTLFKTIGKKDYIQTLYGLLRTTKFIKGEELHDE